MAEGKTYDYTILPEGDDGDTCSPLREIHDRPHLKTWTWRARTPYLATSILLNVLLLAFVLYKNIHHLSLDEVHYNMANGKGVSPYTGFAYDTPYRFDYYNDYWSTNETLADHLWDSIDTDELVVALDESYQSTHGLPPSNPFPWDQSKGLYYIKSVHLLHCLKHLRKVITDYHRTNTTALSERHTYHCLDIYRQYTLCHADDTPMHAGEENDSLGDGEVLQCRSMDRLRQWTKEGERNACFRMVDDYKPTAHTLEKYQYCEKDSPYYERMTQYFDKHGHKPLFKEDEVGAEG